MGSFILTLIVGAAAGALTARTLIRRELRKDAARTPDVAPDVAHASACSATSVAPTAPVAPVAPPASEITPEILMVLTAAVSAFLGKKAKIRRARVAQYAGLSSAWAQQGRVFVQASHNLPSPHHTR
jgi:methylmalonyl-CoA carboxyltransferase 12S subunit